MKVVIGLILTCFDLATWFVTFGPLSTVFKVLLSSQPVIKPMADKADAPMRRITNGQTEMQKTPFEDANVDSLHDMMVFASTKFADCNCMGTRLYLGEVAPDPDKGQRFPPKNFGSTFWLTYAESMERIKQFGAGLRELGMTPQPDPSTWKEFDETKGNHIFIIYENTCADWLTACQGCFSQSIVVSTVYATLGADAVRDAVAEGEVYGLMCNRINVPLIGKMKQNMPSLQLIVYTEDMVKPEDRKSKPAAIPGVTIVSVDELCQLGKDCASKFPYAKPKADSMAVVMYTSGSTGKPKGALIRHKQMLAMVAGIKDHFSPCNIPGKELYAAFLPAAHILELCAEHSMISIGAALGFCDPRTLTSSGAEPHGALVEFKPTIMAAVPKIWDILKKAIEAKVKAGSSTSSFVFHYAVQSKINALKRGMDTPFFNAIVFSKIKKITGGRLKIGISGGGPLEKEVQEFVSAVIVPIIQGYGLTETCGGGTVQGFGDTRTGVVGLPLSCLEIRLVDAVTEDGSGPLCDAKGKPYKTTDTTNVQGEPCLGRGEVWIGGNNVTDGYYKMPKQTKEVYMPGGYFATGDVGEWTTDHNLKIVDRKKNLVKLKGGEYVALEYMETKFNNSEFVDALAGGIMVYAGGDVDRPVAFVQCSKKALCDWAAAEKISGEYEDLLKNVQCRKKVLADLNDHGKKCGLGDLEKLWNATLLNGGMGQGPDAWTPANGGLTPTNKLNRKKAEQLVGSKVMEAGKARLM